MQAIRNSVDCSLSQLNIIPGQVVAFDNEDIDCPAPFILAIPDRLEKGIQVGKNVLHLCFYSDFADGKEEWTLFTRGKALGLWAPRYQDGRKVSSLDTNMDRYVGYSYYVEFAYSGRTRIREALRESRQGLDFYADLMDQGRLITERGYFGSALESLGLSYFLPDQIRFR